MTPWEDYYKKPDNLRRRPKRAAFWQMILAQTKPAAVLEVGCGDGLNLEHIRARTVVGVDLYEPSLELARERATNAWLVHADARDLWPCPDAWADLAFTCTTLQHIADDEECRAALRELIRISRDWVLVMEYSAPVRTPVEWRGNPEGIVKRPWNALLIEEGVAIRAAGFLAHDPDGFDDVSWWLGK